MNASTGYIENALENGAILTAQYSSSTGFALHLSWPMLEGVPHLEAQDNELNEAFAKLDFAVMEDMAEEHDAGEAELVRKDMEAQIEEEEAAQKKAKRTPSQIYLG